MSTQTRTDKFIRKAIAVHADRYDYSRVKYKNSKSKVEIVCPEHGSFWQVPSSHLVGSTCRACSYIERGKAQRRGKNEFVDLADAVHHGKYDYSLVDYLTSKKKVEIGCKVIGHGTFWQEPTPHLNGQGCPICADVARSDHFRKTTIEFIRDAMAVHDIQYDYSSSNYEGAFVKVEIVCSQHGSFWQTPDAHVNQKQGCPQCGMARMADSLRHSKEIFSRSAHVTHNNYYDYSLVVYEDNGTKVEIICPKHGPFWASPNDPPPLSWSTPIVSKGGPNNGYQETSSGRNCCKITAG